LWETPAGKRVSIKSKRIVSFEHRHLAAISYEVTLLNAEAPVVISSQVLNRQSDSDSKADPRRSKGFQHRVLLSRVAEARDRRLVLGYVTQNSRMTLACAVDHEVQTDCPCSDNSKCDEDLGKVIFSADAKPGQPIRIVKYIAYHTSRSARPEELCERAERTLDRAAGHGFEALAKGQRRYLDEFWSKSDVRLKGDPAAQQAVRFNLFHILQAAGRAEGVGIPAKGVTGQGYEGHYFWDTEIYVLPFLIYTMPRVARNLLKFRHSFLERARERAREVNQRGALFPWRTINGEEASAYYAAGTAQYHINADIAYALKKYVDATGDVEFLHEVGAEILVETARLWFDLGFFSKRQDGRFCIHGVTGPDEYNTVVNNTASTNLMARETLWYAAKTVTTLEREHADRFKALVDHTGLESGEVEQWQRAADNMYIPYDDALGINPQDDSFLEREPWDFENTPPDMYPLLLHHHPLVIYRHQIIKQADVVLAMFLLGHEFSAEQKKRNFDFYDPLTNGDSSLSSSVQAIVAGELGYDKKAFDYARYAAVMDLADVGGNVRDGLHIASMGGTWMALVYGLGGMRDWNGRIQFRPQRPRRFDECCFCLQIRGRWLQLCITRESVTYSLLEGDELTILHGDEEVRLFDKRRVCQKSFAQIEGSQAE